MAALPLALYDGVMRDYLLELAQDTRAKKLVRAVGLEVPLPVRVRRSSAPWVERALAERVVVAGGAEYGMLSGPLGRALAAAGATLSVVASERAAQLYRDASDRWLEPVRVLPPVVPAEDSKADALLFDATGIRNADRLRDLYDFFTAWLPRLHPCGRVLIVSRPSETGELPAATARAALTGFCRSLAKEIGRSGTTVNLVIVEPHAEERLAGVVQFLLSDHAAFITGQELRVTLAVRANVQAGAERALSGKVALITGAAGGIGSKAALALAREGAHVVCLDRPEQRSALEQVATACSGSMLALDVSDATTPGALAQALRERHGGVDIVVHNAGIARNKTLLRMKPDAWDAVLRVNLSAVVRMTEALLSEAVLRDEGRLIAVSAVAALAGNSGQTNFAASKAGLIGLVRSLSPRLAPSGITVNAVAPGLIETGFIGSMPAALRQFARRMSALVQGGQPEDVAEAIAFLASPAAHGISDSVLRVCGGAFVGA